MRLSGKTCWALVLLACVKYSRASDKIEEHPKLFLYAAGYETNEIPIIESGARPFPVTVSMNIWEITDVSLEKQDVGVDMILEVTWIDPRLTVNPNITSQRLWHIITDEEARRLWRPTLGYRNCKGCHLIELKPPFYMKKSDGMLWVQYRSVTRFSCNIDLRSYPMDYQICPVKLYINDDYSNIVMIQHLKLEDQTTPTSNMTLSEFVIPSMTKQYCNFPDENDSEKQSFSCLEIQIHFDRLVTYHLMTSYIPTTFIVIISWISFWLPVDVVPARIALGLTLLLTMATRLDQAQKNLPPVSYAKAIDVWMFACICMVCASLLEFATSHYVSRIHELKLSDQEKESKRSGICLKTKIIQVQPIFLKRASENQLPKKKKKRDGTPLDRASRAIFPLFFLCFNIFYWTFYRK